MKQGSFIAIKRESHLFASSVKIDLVVLFNVFGDSMRGRSSAFFESLDGSSDHGFERRVIFLSSRFGLGGFGGRFTGHVDRYLLKM